ncbi:MAG: hypothetical protein JRJ04_18055, partial [Deltaproteobacteria bacterium]|nr:hypothetical protein [Deltaproteobacteria bacterium]
MKPFKLFLCLPAILAAAVPAAFASGPGRVIWWELENSRMDYGSEFSMAKMQAFLERPKRLMLREGRFPNSASSIRPSALDNAEIWARNPDGIVSELHPSQADESVALDLPSDLNPGKLTGRYLIGIHLDAGVMDFDSDGTDERVHLYSNCLVRYYKQDGIKGENQDIFFKDRNKMALEIGSFKPKSVLKSAGSPVAGANIKGDRKDIGYMRVEGSQLPLREYRMKVLYKGGPLANAEVVVLSKTGWKKTLPT